MSPCICNDMLLKTSIRLTSSVVLAGQPLASFWLAFSYHSVGLWLALASLRLASGCLSAGLQSAAGGPGSSLWPAFAGRKFDRLSL